MTKVSEHHQNKNANINRNKIHPWPPTHCCMEGCCREVISYSSCAVSSLIVRLGGHWTDCKIQMSLTLVWQTLHPPLTNDHYFSSSSSHSFTWYLASWENYTICFLFSVLCWCWECGYFVLYFIGPKWNFRPKFYGLLFVHLLAFKQNEKI